MSEHANVTPTKEFFINMLTRDIALDDAILDLLDNCLDGVIRAKGAVGKRDDKTYYSGFSAEIQVGADFFEIKDNCGGIPRKVAIESAFRMGRGAESTDANLPTVGIYGIGMKRAIFKLGKAATVRTRHGDDSFVVSIEDGWANTPAWEFPLATIPGDELSGPGTCIRISQLTDSVAAQWGNDYQRDSFVESLVTSIQTSYSLIIEKGFVISVNGQTVSALPVQLLVSYGKEGIKPYMYIQEYDGVQVQLAVGFYAPPPSDDEIDENNESKRFSADAGWTIVCNDRVVLYNDRTHLTGWGEAGVPQYHTQFIGIRGIVVFESDFPERLPMTTTKRGIDLSSPLYAAVKNKMRDGLKMFTDYTNKWKGRNTEEREVSAKAHKISYRSLFENSQEIQQNYGITLHETNSGSILKPDLPKPLVDKNYVIIRYSKAKEDVERVAQFFYNDQAIDIRPSDIGEKCFDKVMKEYIASNGGD